MNKPDPLQQARQRDLLIQLLKAYGVTEDLSKLDNEALKKELERVFWGTPK